MVILYIDYMHGCDELLERADDIDDSTLRRLKANEYENRLGEVNEAIKVMHFGASLLVSGWVHPIQFHLPIPLLDFQRF